ncbi:hypothetical protein IWW37_003698 [Coemansia sp. RSA 2050]|nr:hypothetical protein IWW37_003698 [Coemansia sp. RSA 2050]
MEWCEEGFNRSHVNVDDKLEKTLYEVLVENGSGDDANIRSSTNSDNEDIDME